MTEVSLDSGWVNCELKSPARLLWPAEAMELKDPMSTLIYGSNCCSLSSKDFEHLSM